MSIFDIFKSRRVAQTSARPPFNRNVDYWLHRYARSETYWRATVAKNEEVSRAHRQDWWGNYPGVDSAIWQYLAPAASMLYAGQRDLATELIRTMCLPYRHTLGSPAYEAALRERSPEMADNAMGTAISGLAFAEMLVSNIPRGEAMKRALMHFDMRIQRDLSDGPRQQDGWFESLVVQALQCALISAEWQTAKRWGAELKNVEFKAGHAPRLLGVASDHADAGAWREIATHFDNVRDRRDSGNEWKRPEYFSEDEYLFRLAVLIERRRNDWQGPIDWDVVRTAVIE